MSSLFDIPAQLAMLLSLAATTAGHEPGSVIAKSPADAGAIATVEPLEGVMRYNERTWLRALHENGAAAQGLSSRVFVTSGGRYYIPTPAERRRILDARNDPEVARRVARAAAEHNGAIMRGAIGREPTAGDLYIAHVFGAQAAIALLRAAATTPDEELKSRFPAMAAAAPELYRLPGKPVTVGQFYRKLAASLREPPRLVAIGLRPSVADAATEPEERPMLAWQAQVDFVKAEAQSAPQ